MSERYLIGIDPYDNNSKPIILKMKDNKDNIKGGVTFYEEPHEYKNEIGQKYISVTTLIGKYKEKFNPHLQAIESTSNPRSKYYGRDVEEVKAEWNKKGEDARNRGTAFHKSKEEDHYNQATRSLRPDESYEPNTKMIIPMDSEKVLTDYTQLGDGEYSEVILWSHEYKLAGISDKIIVDGDYFDVEDYKTNKSIDMTSFFDRNKGKYKMLAWPLDHIMDCSYEVYQLQLSIYAYLFAKLSGKKPRNLTIIHHPTKDGVISKEEIRYSCTYKQADVMMMLNMWGGYAPPSYREELLERNQQQSKLPEGL